MIPHKKEINVRLSWHHIRRTAVLAYLHGMSFEEYINHKLREYIKESRET
jgi:predicted DNA binding CopG/RHH family protein